MEAEEHDREDHPAVFVNITPSHPEYSMRRFGRGQGRKWKLYGLLVSRQKSITHTVPAMHVSWKGVVTSAVDSARHHTTRMKLYMGLKKMKNSEIIASGLGKEKGKQFMFK